MQREMTGVGKLRAPDDGIVASHRPRGRLGRDWLELMDARSTPYGDRLARGRSWARSGRVRDLWFAPGLASAEVVDSEPYNAVVRVRVFEAEQWDAILEILRADLQHIAALVEGELPRSVLDAFDAAGLRLVPSPSELEPDCNCDDYALPCAHVAAVQYVLADALDGDPFLLLTLRGRPREQIIAALRRSWGDQRPLQQGAVAAEEPPPEGDWFRSPTPVPPLRFSFASSKGPLGGGDGASAQETHLGLLELGPAPGQADLERALRPLYAAGASAALEIALRDPPQRDRRRGRRRSTSPAEGITSATWPTTISVAQEGSMGSNDPEPEAAEQAKDEEQPASQTLTERIVDHLANVEYARSADLARMFDVSTEAVRNELVELEQMGIVYRTGQTRGTRWWLG